MCADDNRLAVATAKRGGRVFARVCVGDGREIYMYSKNITVTCIHYTIRMCAIVYHTGCPPRKQKQL